MTCFAPKDSDFEARVRASFARQAFMRHLGAAMLEVSPGRVVLELPVEPHLAQQHGFVHAGVTTSIADVAGGYAAATLFPADAGIVTSEFKINFLAPARGERLRATGQVIQSGRRISVCESEVVTIETDGTERVCARMLQTAVPVSVGELD